MAHESEIESEMARCMSGVGRPAGKNSPLSLTKPTLKMSSYLERTKENHQNWMMKEKRKKGRIEEGRKWIKEGKDRGRL